MEKRLILTVRVRTYEAQGLEGPSGTVVMIPFDAQGEGELFRGRTTQRGTDTQVTTREGFRFSARYMLEGEDLEGRKCRVYIENRGSSFEACEPRIMTDSPALKHWETAELTGSAEIGGEGVTVRIYERIC